MILANCISGEFTISEGKIVSSDPFPTEVFGLIENPVPGPSEGDPDMVYYKRMKKYIHDCEIIKYIPMEIDEEVVY